LLQAKIGVEFKGMRHSEEFRLNLPERTAGKLPGPQGKICPVIGLRLKRGNWHGQKLNEIDFQQNS